MPNINFMLDCPCILHKQIRAKPTRCNKLWFIGNQLFLDTFRASLRPSSGEQTACHCLWFPVLAMVAVHTVCSPDDGRKDARNVLRNNWLPINHHLSHIVGLALICMSNINSFRSSLTSSHIMRWHNMQVLINLIAIKIVRLPQKVYCAHNAYLILLCNLYSKHSCLKKYLVSCMHDVCCNACRSSSKMTTTVIWF